MDAGSAAPSKGIRRRLAEPPTCRLVGAISLLTMGIGMLLGYRLFHGIFHQECAWIVRQKQATCDASLAALQEHGRQGNWNDAQQQLKAIQDRLESHTGLADQHEHLLQRHEDSVTKLASLRSDLDASRQTIQSLNEQVKRLQRELGQSAVQMQNAKQQSEKNSHFLQQQLDLAKSLVRQKVDEVEELRRHGPQCAEASPTSDPQLVQIQNAVQRRQGAEVTRAYGPGPYMLDFAVTSSDSAVASFHVELSEATSMPHTIYTLLTMVSLGLLNGTILRVDPDGMILGGDPKHCRKRTQADLTRLYAEHGLIPSPLLWTEASAHICPPFGFGFTSLGPEFFILPDGSSDETSASCIGKVVHGQDLLDALRSGSIDEALITSVTCASLGSTDEL